MAESITTRCAKLNQILSSKNGGRRGANSISRELLLDAFMVLFEECQSEDLLKDKNISSFVKKYSPMVKELKSLFLNKDDFEVINTIGRGHFGQVQVVKDKYGGDVYAMKTLKKSQTLAQESVAFYEEEREIMATANNPWITSLQYAFQDSQCLYFVMEYQPGGDLLSLLSKYDDIFDDDMARFYLAEMTVAIHSLHQLGFVHRDVKPDNVLIDRTGHIKLADFGSSARLSNTDRKVYSKMPVGTPEYIAPEVLTSMDGSGGPYGVECDWWSLGVVAYEMMCGQTPFEADSVVITYSKIMNFKSSMRFPDLKISQPAKDLIMSLCTSSKNRLGYEAITSHKYFCNIQWNKLQTTVPPFVPTLDGIDDTSNFDEFEPESPDPTDQLQKYRAKGFAGKDLPFVGFSFIKQTNSPLSPQSCPSPIKAPQPSNLERRLTMKTKELKDALNNYHILSTEKEDMSKSLDNLQNSLSEKDSALRKLESERDLLEKEKVLMETQIKDLQIRLDSERTERNNSDFQTLKLISEIKHNSRKVEEMRDQESKATFEDQQQIISELEQERFIINKRAHRLEEELKIQEKVIEESKHRISDLHSRISKMNEEAKRSMEEWQSKLDKVTEDSQSRINELQDKLNKSLKASQEATSLLENIRRAKDKLEKELKEIKAERNKTSGDEADGGKTTQVRRSDSLVSSIKRREDLAQQIVERIRACGDFHQTDKYKKKAEELRKSSAKVMELEDKLFQNQRELKKLEREVANKKVVQDKLQEKDEEVTRLNRYKRQLENTNKKLEESLADKEKMLVAHETKIKTLQARCQAYDSHTANMATTITQEHITAMEQLKQQKETIAKEFKEQQQKNESLIDKIRTTEDKLFEAQKERTELQQTNKLLEEAVVKLENEIDEKLLRQEVKAANLHAFDELEMQERAEIALELQSQLQQMSKHCESLETEKKELEVKLDNLNDEYTKLESLKEKIEDELKEKQRTIESQELTFSMLKSTCTMLESQVEELEIMVENFEEKEMKWDIARKSLESGRDNMECNTAELKRTAEQEKAARTIAEEKLEKFKQSLDELQSVRLKEVNEMNEKLERQRKRTEDLTELLSESEKKLAIMGVDMKSAERKLQLEVESSNRYKTESERLESLISSLRSENFQLTQRRVELAEQMEIMEANYAEEKLKLEATKAQQTKLIDFLQYKTEGQNSKKKKLIGGGGKSWRKQPHDDRNIVPKQWKDIQQALEKERASSLKLQTELNRTQAELKNTKMEVAHWKSLYQNQKPTQKIAVLSALQQSPSNQQAPIIETHKKTNPPLPSDSGVHRPKERMHHNIPHRFVNVLNMHPVKCAVCLDTVHFGRQSSKCAECSSVCHVKCAPHLSHTCGLPSQFVEHFSEAVYDNNTDSPIKTMTRSVSQIQNGLESWMKVPSGSAKYGWEKKWVRLHDNKIHIFDKENVKDKSSPTETLNLDGTDGHVTIHSSVMSSELLGTAPTDLAYILRIESRPKCWPVQNLYLMAPSFKDKQKWVVALEAMLNELKKVNKQQKNDKTEENLFGSSLLLLENGHKLDMNCTQVLNDELLLIGSEEGLFSLSLSKQGHGTYREIPGIGKVFQIAIIPDLNLAIMIAGKERDLCWVDLKHLQSRSKQVNSEVPLAPLTIQTIEKLKNCHLFAVGQYDNYQFLCAATPNKLHLLRFNVGMNSFCMRKEIDTTEPCNCVYFTESSVVYGTGRFYKLDLKQHTTTEFLDAKDTSLAFAVYGAGQLNIFPIAILDVTSSGSKDQELLLCYNEFGVFVNSMGRQTRQKTLLWTRLPLAFAYKEPFLFVTHFNSIDVCEIPSVASSNTSSFTHKFLDIQNPRVLGPAISPGAVFIVSSMQDQVELLCFQGSSLAAASSCQSDEDHSNFTQLSEMLRTISASSLASEVCSPTRSNGVEVSKSPTPNAKKRRSSFLTNGPFRTPSMKKRKCYEVNP